MNRTIITLLILLILGYGVYYFLRDDTNNSLEPGENGTTTTTGARAEDNSIVVSDQRPGNTVTISQVNLAESGYAVIHDSTGTILGSSELLQAGENDNVRVNLSRNARNGDNVYAELHSERNDNTTFQAASDPSIQSSLGGPIRTTFMISNDAATSTPAI